MSERTGSQQDLHDTHSKLRIEHLSMQYDDKKVLDDIDFVVQEGEFLSILGPSGCGKTTLLRILIGLIDPTEGRIIMDGTISPPHPLLPRDGHCVPKLCAL